MSPQRQICIADPHTVDIPVCSFPKGKLGLPYVKATAVTFQEVNNPIGLTVGKIFGFEDLAIR